MGSQGLTFISQLWFSGNADMEREQRAETWSQSRPGPEPASVYWPDTVGQRGKHYRQCQLKPHNRKRVTWGEERKSDLWKPVSDAPSGFAAEREGAVRQSVYGGIMFCCSF